MGKPLAGPAPHIRLKPGSLRNKQLIKPDLSHIFTTNLTQFVPQLMVATVSSTMFPYLIT